MRAERRYREELKKTFPNRFENKKEVCARRNQYLINFFSEIEENIRIIGNPEKPTIIMDNLYTLSAYVHNFNLKFMSRIFDGDIIANYKLTRDLKLSQGSFTELLKNMEIRRMYRLQYNNSDLFLAGYNFKDREALNEKYPVFSRYNYKLYFTEQRARDIMHQFGDYPLVLV